MGAYVSEKMKTALNLMRADATMTAYRAAEMSGISRSAISQNREYRTMMKERKDAFAKTPTAGADHAPE